MEYEWDEKKRLENIRKHGIDFVGCETVFDGYTITVEDESFPYPERRFITIGLLENRVVVVAHTETESVVRVISIRKATRHEQTLYFKNSPFNDVTN